MRQKTKGIEVEMVLTKVEMESLQYAFDVLETNIPEKDNGMVLWSLSLEVGNRFTNTLRDNKNYKKKLRFFELWVLQHIAGFVLEDKNTHPLYYAGFTSLLQKVDKSLHQWKIKAKVERAQATH